MDPQTDIQWEDHKPSANSKSYAYVSIGVRKTEKGLVRATIGLASELVTALGWLSRLDELKLSKTSFGLKCSSGINPENSRRIVRLMGPYPSREEGTIQAVVGANKSLRVTLPGDAAAWLPEHSTEKVFCAHLRDFESQGILMFEVPKSFSPAKEKLKTEKQQPATAVRSASPSSSAQQQQQPNGQVSSSQLPAATPPTVKKLTDEESSKKENININGAAQDHVKTILKKARFSTLEPEVDTATGEMVVGNRRVLLRPTFWVKVLAVAVNKQDSGQLLTFEEFHGLVQDANGGKLVTQEVVDQAIARLSSEFLPKVGLQMLVENNYVYMTAK